MAAAKQAALCATCLVDQVLPEIGVATVQLLRRAGWAMEFPQAQTCCGQPFFNSGFKQEAVDLAKRVVEIFEPYAAVVLPSGSCTAMIRVEYPHLLEPWPEWRERALALAAKTFELSQFLTHQARWQPAPSAAAPNAAYHDSCHMCRLLQVRQEPRHLLRAVGCALGEMSEADRCCGFGGLFSLRLPEISNAMTAEKLRQADQTGAAVLVTADPGCLLQIRGLAAASGLRVEHLATVLEEATR